MERQFPHEFFKPRDPDRLLQSLLGIFVFAALGQLLEVGPATVVRVISVVAAVVFWIGAGCGATGDFLAKAGAGITMMTIEKMIATTKG